MKKLSSIGNLTRTSSKPNAGLTLVELVVATALVGIVMVGTVSVDYAIRSMRKTTANSASVAIQTSATMTYIANDVAQATGDASDVGILDCTQDNDETIYPLCDLRDNPTFCIRQDQNGPDAFADYTDDLWVCYWKPLDPTDANIYTCQQATPGECATSNDVIGTAACTDAPTCSNYAFSYFLTPPGNGQFYLEVTLTNRPYPNHPPGPKNPEYELTSRIAPVAHSN